MFFSSHLHAISVHTSRYVFQFTLACFIWLISFDATISQCDVYLFSDSGKTEIDSPIPDCTYEASPKLELEGFN